MSPPDKSPMTEVRSVMKGKLRPSTEPALHLTCLALHMALGLPEQPQLPMHSGFVNVDVQTARSLSASATSSGVIGRPLTPTCPKRSSAEMSSLLNRPKSNTPPVHLKPFNASQFAAIYTPDLSANCWTNVLSAL